jgi:hypothetical protein
MDNLNITPETAASLQNLSAKDKQELNQFVLQEGMPHNHRTLYVPHLLSNTFCTS